MTKTNIVSSSPFPTFWQLYGLHVKSQMAVCQVSWHLPVDDLFQLCQFVTFQCFPDGEEKSKVVFKVVHHKQDPSQELVGHQQVVYVRASMILTAVTGTTSHKWIKVLLVPEKGSHSDIPDSEWGIHKTHNLGFTLLCTANS